MRAPTRLVLTAILLLASCSAQPSAQKCSRVDVGSMGEDNAFRLTVATDAAPVLDDASDRLDVAFTLVPPIVAPVILIQSVEGKEVGRWELKVSPATGISTRCRLGATPALSTCGAVIGNLPRSAAGEWTIDARGNRVLEVALSFRTCR